MSKTSSDNASKFAYVYIRPGVDGKAHPIGTVAIKLETIEFSSYLYGIAMQNTKKDKWVASIGRAVAAGRADRAKNPLFITINPSDKLTRRQLILCTLYAICEKATKDKKMMSKQFRRAVFDTYHRILAA